MPKILKRRPGDPCCKPNEPCLHEWLIEPEIYDRGATIEGAAETPLMITVGGEEIETSDYQLVTTIEAVDQFEDVETAHDEAVAIAATLEPAALDFAPVADHVRQQAEALAETANDSNNAAGEIDTLVGDLETLAGEIDGLQAAYDEARELGERDLDNELDEALGDVMESMGDLYTNTAYRETWVVNDPDADELLGIATKLRDAIKTLDESFKAIEILVASIPDLEGSSKSSGEALRDEGRSLTGKVGELSAAAHDFESYLENYAASERPPAVWSRWYGLEVRDQYGRLFFRDKPDNLDSHFTDYPETSTQGYDYKPYYASTEIFENETPFQVTQTPANYYTITHKQYKKTHSIKHPEQDIAEEPETRDLVIRSVTGQPRFNDWTAQSEITHDYDEGAGALPGDLPTIRIVLPNDDVKKYRVKCKRTTDDSFCFFKPVNHPVPFAYRRWRYTAKAFTSGGADGLVVRRVDTSYTEQLGGQFTGIGGVKYFTSCCVRHAPKGENFYIDTAHSAAFNGESELVFVRPWVKDFYGVAAQSPQFLYAWEQLTREQIEELTKEFDGMRFTRPVKEWPMNETQWWQIMSGVTAGIPPYYHPEGTITGHRIVAQSVHDREAEKACTGSIMQDSFEDYWVGSIDLAGRHFHGSINPIRGMYPVGNPTFNEEHETRFATETARLHYKDGGGKVFDNSLWYWGNSYGREPALDAYVFEPHVVESPDGVKWYNPKQYFGFSVEDADGDSLFDKITTGYTLELEVNGLDASSGYSYTHSGCGPSQYEYNLFRAEFGGSAGVRKTWTQDNQIIG